MYDGGRGVAQDYKAAVSWYTKAAAQGDAGAQTDLGLKYAKGQGVTKDLVAAYMWLDIGATNGEGSAERARDIVAQYMAPTDVKRAKDKEQLCIKANYKGCN